jgi:hypothetical protein
MLFPVPKLFGLIKHEMLAQDDSRLCLKMSLIVQELVFPLLVLELDGWCEYLQAFNVATETTVDIQKR